MQMEVIIKFEAGINSMRQKNINGGGAKTNQNGLLFERETDLLSALEKIDYLDIRDSDLDIRDSDVFYKEEKVALITEKHGFYKSFLSSLGVDARKILSKILLPDGALVNFTSKEVFIIEKKFQAGAGSVDEKLQTCDFKLKQYQKLLEGTPYTARFIFLLNSFFEQKSYDDVKSYIGSVNCQYFINELPLTAIKMDEDSLS